MKPMGMAPLIRVVNTLGESGIVDRYAELKWLGICPGCEKKRTN